MNCEPGDLCMVIGACTGDECRKAAVGRFFVKVLEPTGYAVVMTGEPLPGGTVVPVFFSPIWRIEGAPKPCPLGKADCPGMNTFPDCDLQPLRRGPKPEEPIPVPVEPNREDSTV